MGNQAQTQINRSSNQNNRFTDDKSQQKEQKMALYINHPRFHKVPLVQRNGIKLLQITIPVHSQDEIYNWEIKQQILRNISKQNLFLKHSHQFQRQGLCGTSGNVKIFYQNYPNLLIDQITNRRALQHLFDQTEIWYLLYTLISVAKDFQNLNMKVGDIRPDSIYINQYGVIKIANVFSWPKEEANYFKSLESNQITYLAPQQLKDLKNFEGEQSTNHALSESFSIGLTILDAALLKNNKLLYSFTNQNWNFNEQNCWKIIQEWKSSQYSQFLKNIVIDLLDFDVKKRKKPSEIYQLLAPYRQNIQNLIPFNHNLKKVEKNQKEKMFIQPKTPQFMKNQKYKPFEQLISFQSPRRQHFTTIKTPFPEQNLKNTRHVRAKSSIFPQLNSNYMIKRKNFVYSSDLTNSKVINQYKLQKELMNNSTVSQDKRKYYGQKFENSTSMSIQPYSIPFISTQKKIWEPNQYFNNNQKDQQFDYPRIIINGGLSTIKY